MRIFLVVTAVSVWQAACASSGALPADPQTVSAGIAARVGVDARAWPPREPGSLPAGVNLLDGVSIDEAIAAALWNNAAFQVTLADLGFARADLADARMLRNPVLSLLFPLGPKQLEATLSLPVDAFIQRPRRVRAATLDYEAVGARLVADGLRLVADVKSAYIAAATAERRAQASQEAATVAARVRAIADARLAAGDISDMETRATRGEALIAEAAAKAARYDGELAIIRLRALMGVAASLLPARDRARRAVAPGVRRDERIDGPGDGRQA